MVSHGPARKSPFGGMTRRGGGGNMRLPDLPLTSPGTCGARFLRQQEAGATFLRGPLGAGTSRSERANAETISMGAAVAHEISPELALVCPELRAHALTLLPALDPDELFTIAPSPPAPIVAPPRVVLVEQEPEQLVPVELERGVPVPQRRAPLPVALVVYTTEALLLGAARGAALTMAIATVAFVLAR